MKNETLYGREFTSTARIAKMNMVLFGDGHSNIKEIDSLENPVKEEYDIMILSNIPYSQDNKGTDRYILFPQKMEILYAFSTFGNL